MAGFPAGGESQVSADLGQETSRRAKAGPLIRRAVRGCSYTPPKESGCFEPVVTTTGGSTTRWVGADGRGPARLLPPASGGGSVLRRPAAPVMNSPRCRRVPKRCTTSETMRLQIPSNNAPIRGVLRGPREAEDRQRNASMPGPLLLGLREGQRRRDCASLLVVVGTDNAVSCGGPALMAACLLTGSDARARAHPS